jgi:hypothetical protein
MQKGIYERTNKGLEFELINSMNFGKSLISAGFIQKTVKGNIFVKRNQEIILWHLRVKVLEDSRRLSTEGRPATSMPPGLLWASRTSIFQNIPPPSSRVASTPFFKSV